MNSVQNPYDIMDLEDVTSHSLTKVLMFEEADFIKYSASLFCHNPSRQQRGHLNTTRKKPKYIKRDKSVGK